MKTEKRIFLAFILNLGFAFFEFIGGIFTGSTAIISDALHDLGDAFSIGISYYFEKKSRIETDDKGNLKNGVYSVVGSIITSSFLLYGSVAVILNALSKIIEPQRINYNGMIIFAVIGLIINSIAVFITHGKETLNEKSINLHMFEDVLGWIVVLIGAIVMRFTDFKLLDPLMSIGVAVFIFICAIKNLKEAVSFLVKNAQGHQWLKNVIICNIFLSYHVV